MSDKRKGSMLMLITAVLWSSSGVLIKYLTWNPLVIAGGRSFVAVFVMLIYMRARGLKLVLSKTSILSGAAMCATITTFISANKMTTAANAIMLQYTAPIFVLIISAVVLKQELLKQQVAAVAITFGGILLFFLDSLDSGNMLGNVVAFSSGFFYGSLFIVNDRLKDEAEKMSGILLGHILTAVIGLGFGILIGGTEQLALSGTGLRNYLIILFMGVVQIGITYILYGLASSLINAVSCALIGMIEPVLNPIWVALIYGEVPGYLALAGGIVVIATVTAYNIWEEEHQRSGKEIA